MQREASGSVILHTEDFPYWVERIIREPEDFGDRNFSVMRWHENLRFVYVWEGTVEVRTLDQTVVLQAGEGIFINRDVAYLLAVAGVCRCDSFLFPSYFLEFYPGGPAKALADRLVAREELPVYVFREGEEWHERVLLYLRELSALEAQKTMWYPYEVLVRLSSLWLEMQKNIVIPSAADPGKNSKRSAPKRRSAAQVRMQRMQKFLHYIAQHYREEVLLEELAASADVSKSECLRCFRQSLNTTPYKYLIDYRISKAVDILLHTDRQVSEIAVLTGFDQSSYFGKCFRDRLGCTPKEYKRKNLKNL